MTAKQILEPFIDKSDEPDLDSMILLRTRIKELEAVIDSELNKAYNQGGMDADSSR